MTDVEDPTMPMAGDMTRRAFVAVTAGLATATAGGVTQALADAPKLGGFHSPLVAEDDPALTTSHPDLKTPDGVTSAYAAYSKTATPESAGVVVIQHVWGVDAQIRDVVRRFAKEGYVAIAPDLYSGMGAPSGDTATDFSLFVPFAQKLDPNRVQRCVSGAFAWIAHRAAPKSAAGPKVGVTGFCMGGAIALKTASVNPRFSAAAVWYGRIRPAGTATGTPDAALDYTDTISMPLLGSYGGRDTGIPVADVLELRKRLNVPNDIKIYDEAGHAFFDDQRASYVPSAAVDAWKRTLNWFSTYLS